MYGRRTDGTKRIVNEVEVGDESPKNTNKYYLRLTSIVKTGVGEEKIVEVW